MGSRHVAGQPLACKDCYFTPPISSPLKSIAAEEAKAKLTMTSVPAMLAGCFSSAVRAAFPGFKQLKGIVQASSGGKFGDYKCNVAMAISQVKAACLHYELSMTPFLHPADTQVSGKEDVSTGGGCCCAG